MWRGRGEVRGGEARGGVGLGVEVEAWMAPALVRVLGQQGGWGGGALAPSPHILLQLLSITSLVTLSSQHNDKYI